MHYNVKPKVYPSPWRLYWDLHAALRRQWVICSLLFMCGLVPPACAGLQEEATPPAVVHPFLSKADGVLMRDTGTDPSGLLRWESHFTPAWLWAALLQELFEILSFLWPSLWKQLVKLNDFKEQLSRISGEINKSVPWNWQATRCCPQSGTVWAEQVPWLGDHGVAWSRWTVISCFCQTVCIILCGGVGFFLVKKEGRGRSAGVEVVPPAFHKTVNSWQAVGV